MEERLRPVEILLLIVDPGRNAGTIRDHIDAFKRFSRHRFSILNNNAAALRPMGIAANTFPTWTSLANFDALVIHYTNYLADPTHFDERARRQVHDYDGLKILFIQDEYRTVDATVGAIRDLGIDVLYTCVPESEMEKVYPASKLPGVTKKNTLTGFVPDRLAHLTVPPIERRPIDVGYRTRQVPFWLGELGAEKWQIVPRFLKAIEGKGLNCDVSYREEDRLYGRRWIRFLTSCRSVLGTESGASVFDFTGDIQRSVDGHVRANPEASFEEVQAKFLRHEEHRIRLNQISPRAFEAAALRTGMVLYEGDYSGILKPDRHYIPLRKDLANIDDVIGKIRNTELMRTMIKIAHAEVAMNHAYSYARFVAEFDTVVEAELESRGKLVARRINRGRRLSTARSLLAPRLLALASRGLPAGVKAAMRPLVRRVLGAKG